jgi:hypothetical protein
MEMSRNPLNLALTVVLAASVSTFQASAQELLVNGDFEGDSYAAGNNDVCPVGWTLYETRDSEDSQALPVLDNGPGASGTTAWNCRRNASSATGDWTCLEQTLDYTVKKKETVTLSLDAKVISHSLAAGGSSYPGWEWPVEVLVYYDDQDGISRSYLYGFYVSPPGDGRADDGHEDELVNAGQWVHKELRLAAEIPDLKTITKVRVGGSGWAYDGCIDNVSLYVKPRPVMKDPPPSDITVK